MAYTDGFKPSPIQRRETADDTYHRLYADTQRYRALRIAAKARAISEGFPGVTPDTPWDAWDCMWTDDLVGKFLLHEEARNAANQAVYSLAAE